MSRGKDERVWERGWEGHEQEQLARLAALPLAEKLRWLEEADRVVRHLSGAKPASWAEMPGSGRRALP